MSATSKWAEKRQRPTFSERLALAQPLLAAGALTFFTLILGLPILHLLNLAFPADMAPAGLLANFRLGALYNEAAGWLRGPLSGLVMDNGGLSLGGVLVAALAFAGFAWAVAMMLLAQWRAQLPVMEEVVPVRFLVAVLLTLILIPTLFWLVRMAGPGALSAQAALVALLHFAFGFILILAWYFALSGTFVSWPSLALAAVVAAFAMTIFAWVLGALLPANLGNLSGFSKVGVLIAHMAGLWLILVFGVHFLARQTLEQSDWQDMEDLTRGQQVDFALAIMKTLGHSDNNNRWMSGAAICERLGAKHSLTIQALRRLNEFDLVRASQASNRPDHWRLSTESLHAVNLSDLMEAFGATLDPTNGVYEEGPQPAMLDLADQERRVFRTDLASLTRGDRSPALSSDAPAFISLITDKGVGTQTDAAGAPLPLGEGGKAYERLSALLETEAGTSQTPASQVSGDFPAFGEPPRTQGMSRTKAAALEAETPELEPEQEPEVEEIKLEPEEVPEVDAEQVREESAPAAKPAVAAAVGLTSLITDLPDNLGSYTMALVSPKEDGA